MPRVLPASIPAVLVAAVSAAGLFYVAISQGSYDVVDRQSAALVIWWAVALGAVVLAPPARPNAAGIAATAFAVGIAGWIALNLGSSISVERSVNELARAVAHLGPLVLLAWVMPARFWRPVLVGLVIGATAICAASLGHRLSPGFLGQSNSDVFATTGNRLAAPFGYWNAVGSWAVLTAMLLLGASAHHPRAAVRGLALAPLPLVTLVGYLTYSRATIGALLLGLVVLLAVSRNRWTLLLHAVAVGVAAAFTISVVRGHPELADGTGTAGGGAVLGAVIVAGAVIGIVAALTGRSGVDGVRLARRPALVTFAVAAVATLGVAGLLVDRYGQQAWDQFNTSTFDEGTDPTDRLTKLNGTRLAQWRVALRSWEDDKTHGTGAGTFELTYNVRGDSAEFVRDSHNAYVEALSEQGWPGFVLLCGLTLSMLAAVVLAARRARSALDRGLIAGAGAALAAFTFGTVVDWFWEVTALAFFVMALLGVVIAAGARRPDLDPEAAPRPEPGRWGSVAARLAVVAVATVAVLVQLPGLVGTSEVRRSGQEVAAGDLVAARTSADEAIDLMYWASSPYLQRALVEERAGNLRAARVAVRLAIRRDTMDWRLPLVLARIEAKAGRPRAALRAYDQAKALRPGSGFFR